MGRHDQLRVEAAARKALMPTRKGLDWTEDFCAIAEAATGLNDCILDGEVVALDHNGAPDFSTASRCLRCRHETYLITACTLGFEPMAQKHWAKPLKLASCLVNNEAASQVHVAFPDRHGDRCPPQS